MRNICAHHSRLWNIKLTISPRWPRRPRGLWVNRWENEESNLRTNDKVLKSYAILCILCFLLDRINPYHSFKKDLKKIITDFPEVDLAHAGFPLNWTMEDLWK